MSALDLDEGKNRLDVSRFAPPHIRTPRGEATIRPVLERLSRGERQQNSNSAAAQSVPPVEPIQIQDASPSPKFPLSMTGRLAVAMGLVAALTTMSFTFLKSKAEHPASAASTDSPKTVDKTVAKTVETSAMADGPKQVNTVSFRPDQAAASISDRADALPAKSATTGAGSELPLAAPLTMWAMFPDDPATPAWNPAAGQPNAGDVEHAAAKPAARTPHRTAAAKHTVRHKRRTASRRSRRRHTRTATAKPQPQQQAEAPAETQAAATQPVKKLPLQAALDKLFGNAPDGASNNADSAAPAPATPRAAFR